MQNAAGVNQTWLYEDILYVCHDRKTLVLIKNCHSDGLTVAVCNVLKQLEISLPPSLSLEATLHTHFTSEGAIIMKHTYRHFRNVRLQLRKPCRQVCCLRCGQSRFCRSVWGESSGNLIKVGIMRACWAAGVTLCFLTPAYRFTLISPVITRTQTDTHPHERSIRLYGIDELLRACSKVGSNFTPFVLKLHYAFSLSVWCQDETCQCFWCRSTYFSSVYSQNSLKEIGTIT